MAHDAATGYLTNHHGMSLPINLYAKNQVGTVYQQLQDGARALDVRPHLLLNGTVLLHHGMITIPVSLQTLVQDARQWAQENPSELVLVLHHNMGYESGISPSADVAVSALSQVYQSLGVPYVSCDDVVDFTVEQVMELARLGNDNDNGYLLALDRQDAYASSCAKLNYVESQMITCYPSHLPTTTTTSTTTQASIASSSNVTSIIPPCTHPPSPTLSSLQEYALASANNEPTDDSSTLGPPASWESYPFNAIQALWQVDTHSAVMGLAHKSSIIDDNIKSHLNAHVAGWVYQSDFDAISLLFVDHVHLNGNVLLSVLRTACGQFDTTTTTMTDDDGKQLPCGTNVDMPTVQDARMSTMWFRITITLYTFLGLVTVWGGRRVYRHYYYDHRTIANHSLQDKLAIPPSSSRVLIGEIT
eukprot:Nitzschia sp. Nitz4//scaffold266_size26515//8448//9698//NITZ4_008255-RA/size26515-processed-gene-0.2-mRNA-1//1//CDS//3329544862//6795//frame0